MAILGLKNALETVKQRLVSTTLDQTPTPSPRCVHLSWEVSWLVRKALATHLAVVALAPEELVERLHDRRRVDERGQRVVRILGKADKVYLIRGRNPG